jgi:hypothetical protein
LSGGNLQAQRLKLGARAVIGAGLLLMSARRKFALWESGGVANDFVRFESKSRSVSRGWHRHIGGINERQNGRLQ